MRISDACSACADDAPSPFETQTGDTMAALICMPSKYIGRRDSRLRAPAAEHVVRVGPLAVGETGHSDGYCEIHACPGHQPAPPLPIRQYSNPQRQDDQAYAADLRTCAAQISDWCVPAYMQHSDVAQATCSILPSKLLYSASALPHAPREGCLCLAMCTMSSMQVRSMTGYREIIS